VVVGGPCAHDAAVSEGGGSGYKTLGNRRRSDQAVEAPLTAKAVVMAVGSLYRDELKPFGRILRKRVAELLYHHFGEDTAEEGKSSPNVDMKQLRAICGSCKQLQVELEEGGDWSARLVDSAPNFVDIYDPVDIYPQKLWDDISLYFESLAGTSLQFLPGGRYSCTQALVARQLPCQANVSLGRICHIVQLAISQKKILGYLDGAVVPYACSQSMMKEQKAGCQMPFNKANGTTPELPFATMEQARGCLKAILETKQGEGWAQIPLSNIKRLFRSRFQLELSETILGHSKLSELLQDECFSRVCTVKLAGRGHVVMPKEQAPVVPGPQDAFMGARCFAAPAFSPSGPLLGAGMVSPPPGLELPAQGRPDARMQVPSASFCSSRSSSSNGSSGRGDMAPASTVLSIQGALVSAPPGLPAPQRPQAMTRFSMAPPKSLPTLLSSMDASRRPHAAGKLGYEPARGEESVQEGVHEDSMRRILEALGSHLATRAAEAPQSWEDNNGYCLAAGLQAGRVGVTAGAAEQLLLRPR